MSLKPSRSLLVVEDQSEKILPHNEDFQTERASFREDNNISFDGYAFEDTAEKQHDEIDFSVPEISELKRALYLKQTGEALQIIKQYPSLSTLPLYQLFGIYLSIWYDNREIFNLFYTSLTKSASKQEITALDQKALALLDVNTFDNFLNDLEECKTIFTEIVVYRALDFNVREIFSHGFQNNAQIKLRRPDALTLIKYKHFEEMELTFNKNIKKGLVKLFFDNTLKIEEEAYYSKYCLAFYLELMLVEGYSNKEVLEYSEKLMDSFDVDQALHVFIRYGQLELLQWTEQQKAFKFEMQYLGLAINYESFDIVLYFFQKHDSFIKKNLFQIPYFVIQSFQRSNSYAFIKYLLVGEYFRAFQVEHFEGLLNIMSDKYSSPREECNPFLYTLNPLGLGILQIQILRQVAMKFKSLEVRCLQIEDYIQESILKFLDDLSDDEVVNFMLVKSFCFSTPAIYLLADLKLYKIIQHRNVQEVVNTLHRSEYSVEGLLFDNIGVFAIASREDMLQTYDYETKYRFYNQNLDRTNIKQSSTMFHIWKKSTLIRYNMEFLTTSVFTLTCQLTLIFFMNYISQQAPSYFVLEAVAESSIGEIDPFTFSLINYHCSTISDTLSEVYISLRLVALFYFLQKGFLVKIVLDSLFIKKTQRTRNFFEPLNIMIIVVGLIGVVFIIYVTRFQVEDDHNFVLCAQFGGFDQRQFDQLYYITSIFSKQQFLTWMFTVEILALWILLLLYMRLFQSLGTLLKIIFKMFEDFLKIIVFYAFMLLSFSMIGFTLFVYLPEFSSYELTFQVLFDATVGNFDFQMFKTTDLLDFATFIEFDTLGEIYIIIWLIFSNIMLLNLMIAVFSDTYSKLKEVGEGLYLIEIIEMSPEKRYDKYYSGLVSYPFPFNCLVLPFYPIYLFVRNEKFNTAVLKIGHFVTFVCIFLPGALLFSPIVIVVAYWKCCINKIALALSQNNWSDRGQRTLEFFIFFFFGPLILILNTLFDLVKQYYFLTKPEEEMNFRNQRESFSVNTQDIERVLNTFCPKSRSQEMMSKQKTKLLIKDLRVQMKVESECTQLLMGLGNSEEIFSLLKSFTKIKQFLIENSIREDGDLYIYPKMLKGVISDIVLQEKARELKKRNKSGLGKHQNYNQVHSQQKRDQLKQQKMTEIYLLLFKAQIRVASKAFVKKRTLDLEEQQLHFANQTITKTIDYVDGYVQEGKQRIVKKYQENKK